jgi:hypothetical protein
MPHPGRFTAAEGIQYPLYRSLGGPQGRYKRVRQISLRPGFDPCTSSQILSNTHSHTAKSKQCHPRTTHSTEIINCRSYLKILKRKKRHCKTCIRIKSLSFQIYFVPYVFSLRWHYLLYVIIACREFTGHLFGGGGGGGINQKYKLS